MMTYVSPGVVKRPSFKQGQVRANGRYMPTAAERREIDDEIRRDRVAAYGPQMIALCAEAKAFREQWGVFTRDGWRFDSVTRNGRYVSQIDEDHLRADMKRTKADAAARAAEALAAPYIPVDGDNLMSDAQVAAGVRALRQKGWDAYDKSRGDCCNALLDIDYAGAIALARGIIGKYSKTLFKAGVL